MRRPKLGCRSSLVLMKLGFDLRPYLDDTFCAPLPFPLRKLAEEVDGYAEWHEIGAAEPAGDQLGTEEAWETRRP